MSLRSLLAIAVMGLVLSVSAEAAGDPAHGKTLGYTCLGCHGIENYKSVYPTFAVPRLRGQQPEYIVAALQGYKKSERNHATMHAHASSMSDQDMQDLAAYLAGETVKPAAGAKPVGTAPAKAALCQACHGANGEGAKGLGPVLSGQHADYLEHALVSYKSGARKNALMGTVIPQLKAEDFQELAEYFAHQKPALKTVPKNEKIAAK
ncbi:MAG: c-type cytochrome [Steroidobacteraceae bacterium]